MLRNVTCYEAPVLLPDGLKFGVWSLGLTRNFTEVKQDGGVLDDGFSSCTVPTFCRSLDISDGGSGLQGEVRGYKEGEGNSNNKSSRVKSQSDYEA